MWSTLVHIGFACATSLPVARRITFPHRLDRGRALGDADGDHLDQGPDRARGRLDGRVLPGFRRDRRADLVGDVPQAQNAASRMQGARCGHRGSGAPRANARRDPQASPFFYRCPLKPKRAVSNSRRAPPRIRCPSRFSKPPRWELMSATTYRDAAYRYIVAASIKSRTASISRQSIWRSADADRSANRTSDCRT